MSTGGRAEGNSSSHPSSPIPRGPPTPSTSSAFSDGNRSAHSILADRYLLLTELGRGANGRVFKAIDLQDVRYVAVKQIPVAGISKEQLALVVGEIDLLKNLDHENIVQYYDSIKTNNHLYIILELMESGALAGVVKHMSFVSSPEKWVAMSVAQVLKGLTYLHAQGVVHRDIKGANILTTKDMVIKLADFGVAAKLADRGKKEDYSNTVAGSPYWMAPEVIEMKSITTAADIWSIGCLVVELLTGSAPYFDCQPAPAIYKIVQDKHPPLPKGISEALRTFLLACFIKDPRNRPTAEELLKHEWICENQGRSISPNKIRAKATSPVLMSSRTYESASLVSVILNKKSIQAKLPDASLDEPEITPDRSESPLASSQMSRSSSAQVNASGHEGTDIDEETDEMVRRPSSDRQRKNLQIPPAHRTSTEKPQSRVEYGSSETPPTSGDKSWKDDGQSAGNQTTSTFLASRTSSPDPRIHSPRLLASAKEESILQTIFTDRIYDFEISVHRSRADQWSGFESSQLASLTGRADGDVGVASYDPTNVRKVIGSLQLHLPLYSIRLALRDLVNLIRINDEAKSVFVHSDGLLTLMELLQIFDDPELIERSLTLANCMCKGDALMLRDAAAVGLAAEIFRFVEKSYLLSIRIQAAEFLQSMCSTGVKPRDCFVQCQGLKYLILLLEDGERKSLELKEIALTCMDRILETHVALESKILRMLCVADLPKRLISALSAVHQNRETYNEGGGAPTPDLVPTTMNLARKSSGSMASISEPMNPPSPSDVSTSPSQERPLNDDPAFEEPGFARILPTEKPDRQSPVQELSQKMTDLLIKISLQESEVYGHLVRSDILKALVDLVHPRVYPNSVIYKVTTCLKHLSERPAVVEHLQKARAVPQLIPLLGQQSDTSVLMTQIKIESLTVIENICKLSPKNREEAVEHDIVPYLCILSRSICPPSLTGTADRDEVRKLSVPLLCRLLTVSSPNTRQILWEHDVGNLFLELLAEDRWHQVVLDALATWMEEDIHQVEEKLVSDEAVQTLISILYNYLYRSSDEIASVLEPMSRMLTRSDRLSRAAGLNGMAQVILEMLKEADAASSLRLLKALRRIYGMHPRPKEFINKYGVQQHLEHLANSDPNVESRILVRKEATDLLNAFQMNQIW